MGLACYTGGYTATNGWLLEDEGLPPLLIDAPHGVEDWLAQRRVQPAAVLLTHQHFDHLLGLPGLLEAQPGLEVYAHSAPSPALTLETMLGMNGLSAACRVTRTLAGAERLEVAGREFALAYIPGHSVDSLTFYEQAAQRVFTGDTLMAGTTGRTDFPMGSTAQLLTGIHQHLLSLPDATAVHSGHGASTTIGAERVGNRLLQRP